ncbi:MAG: HXXEE domain-containing protein [Pseudomonadota bacterium]
MSRYASPAIVVLAFGMLWIPFGQHEFLLQHWMKVGTFMAPFLILIAVTFTSDGVVPLNARAMAVLLWVAYIVHQFEEHWIDLYGRSYAFKPYLNDFLSNLLGQTGGAEILSDASVFVINTSLVWLVGALAVWRGSGHIFATLCMAAIVVVNAISHIAAGVASQTYNPGLLTAIAVFVPLGGAVYLWSLRTDLATAALCFASILWALLGHIFMIAGLLALNGFGHSYEPIYFAVLIAWSVLPCFLFPTTASKRPTGMISAN